MDSGNCAFNTLSSVPLDPCVYYRSDDIQQLNPPEVSEFERNSILAGGVGEVAITSVFYGASDLNVRPGDPRYDRLLVPTWDADLQETVLKLVPVAAIGEGRFEGMSCSFAGYAGHLYPDDALYGTVDGHPAMTWTLKAYALDFNANGGVVDTSGNPGSGGTVHRLYDGPGIGTTGTFSGLDGISASRPGYGFTGWSESMDENDDLVSFVDGTYAVSPGDGYEKTLYAQWESMGGVAFPDTGGTGTGPIFSCGVIACLAGFAAILIDRRRHAVLR